MPETDSESAIPFGLLEAAFTSAHVPELFGGDDTHEPALRFVGQLVRHTQDVDHIVSIGVACLPTRYFGNTPAELRPMVEDAIRQGFHKQPVKSRKGTPKPSEQCVTLAERASIELFHDPQRQSYITIPRPGGGALTHRARLETAHIADRPGRC